MTASSRSAERWKAVPASSWFQEPDRLRTEETVPADSCGLVAGDISLAMKAAPLISLARRYEQCCVQKKAGACRPALEAPCWMKPDAPVPTTCCISSTRRNGLDPGLLPSRLLSIQW